MDFLKIGEYDIPIYEIEMRNDAVVYMPQLRLNLSAEQAMGLALALCRVVSSNNTDMAAWVEEYTASLPRTIV